MKIDQFFNEDMRLYGSTLLNELVGSYEVEKKVGCNV